MQHAAVTQLNSVLLATDFADRSAQAELFALSLAEKFGASLHIVNAIEPIIGVNEGDEDAAEFEEFYAKLVRRADEQAEERIRAWNDKNLIVKHHVEIGPRWRVVLEYATKAGVDLIVLGRRTFDGSGELAFGTTSQKIFFGSNRPVLFVPNDG